MSRKPPCLLSIVELGGYPDYSGLYEQIGFTVKTSYSMRKALKCLHTARPAVIVVEFRYGPVYGSRLSNLESLFAVVQVCCPQARLVILLDAEDRKHLQRLLNQLPQSVHIAATLTFPIDQAALVRVLQQARSDFAPAI